MRGRQRGPFFLSAARRCLPEPYRHRQAVLQLLAAPAPPRLSSLQPRRSPCKGGAVPPVRPGPSQRKRMNPVLRRACATALLAGLLPLAFAATAQPATNVEAGSGYQLPVPALQALVDAPRPPQASLSPNRDLLAFIDTPSLPGIDIVAQQELRLAGMRIHPHTWSRSAWSFGTGLSLRDVDGERERPVEGLPAELAIASIAWSPDQRYLAFSQVDNSAGEVQLWLVDVASASARRLAKQPLNAIAGSGFTWMPDSSALLATLRPADAGTPPAGDGVPTGPNIQQTDGGAVQQIRTYQDLLSSEADARVFEHYMRSQLALVGTDGEVRTIGSPDLHVGASPSPDGRHLLVQVMERPFSYMVPYHRFPRRVQVLDTTGALVHDHARLPLVEGLPVGNDAVATGMRSIGWRNDAPATLVWVEAQDGGDPAVEAAVRDRGFALAAAYTDKPQLLADLSKRYAGITWGNGELALVSERWWKARPTRTWKIAPDAPQAGQELVFDRSYEDRYRDPGAPVTALDANGRSRLVVAGNGEIFLQGAGASPEGYRPFLDRLDLETGKATRLF